MTRTIRNAWSLVWLSAVLAGAGCSSFNRDWKKAAENATRPTGLAGRWEGSWNSEVNGHNGRLRALITESSPGMYSARFHAKYQKILSFGYTVPLKVKQTGNLCQPG